MGNKVLKRRCRNQDDAIRIMQKEAEADNLNFLPIATFTKDGTTDMVKGYFMYEALGVSANSFNTPALDKQPEIEVKIREYMDLLQTTGITLPFFGKGLLSLDMRTGFYILPQVISKTLTVPLPVEELAGGGGGGGGEEPREKPYRHLVLPLKTEQDKKHALDYILIFRNAVPSKFMEKYGLDKGFGVRRAMIFNRPPVLPRVFQELGLDVPAKFNEGIRRAAALFQKNTGVPRKTAAKAKPVAEPGAKPEMPVVFPGAYGGLLEKQAAKMPGTPEGARTPAYGPGTPTGRPATPRRTPYFASGGTRKAKATVKKTRKQAKKTIEKLAKEFSKVWKKFDKRKG